MTDWKDGFLFVGNELVLDFLNTRPVLNGDPTELLEDFGKVTRWFEAAGLIGAEVSASLHRAPAKTRESAAAALRSFRERFRQEVLHWEETGNVSPKMVEELNRLMAEHPMVTRLSQHGRGLKIHELFVPNAPEDLIAPLVLSAARLFASGNHTRVRKCGQCVLHFHDISKKGTRRWCSMQLCGNRVKVAAYAARRREP